MLCLLAAAGLYSVLRRVAETEVVHEMLLPNVTPVVTLAIPIMFATVMLSRHTRNDEGDFIAMRTGPWLDTMGVSPGFGTLTAHR